MNLVNRKWMDRGGSKDGLGGVSCFLFSEENDCVILEVERKFYCFLLSSF